MSDRKQKIKRKSKKTNHLTNKESIKTIADNAVLSTNTVISAAGGTASGKAVTLGNAITDANNKRSASVSATGAETDADDAAVDAYNDMATIIEQQLPDNPNAWKAFGCEVTDAATTDASKCPAGENCSVSQGDALGTADVHHDPIPGATTNKVLVTKGAATDRTSYIDVTNTDASSSKSNTTITLPSDYIGVPLNWIVIGHNTAGDGFDSTPFGGGRKIN